MSHFNVLVIGEDVEGQLSPYDENLEVDEEIERFSAEDIKRARELLGEYQKQGSSGASNQWASVSPERLEEEKARAREINIDDDIEVIRWANGAEEIEQDAEGLFRRYMTNNKAKWDWWVVGGRWSGGVLRVKEGVMAIHGEPSGVERLDPNYLPPPSDYADECCASEVDWEGMRKDAEEEARKNWTQFYDEVEGQSFVPWREILAKHGEANIGEARAEYHGQKIFEVLRQTKDRRWDFMKDTEISKLMQPLEIYLEGVRKEVGCTYAVVKDGIWYQKGEMGWFGISHHEKEEAEWTSQFHELIEGLTPETRLTVVDCHI